MRWQPQPGSGGLTLAGRESLWGQEREEPGLSGPLPPHFQPRAPRDIIPPPSDKPAPVSPPLLWGPPVLLSETGLASVPDSLMEPPSRRKPGVLRTALQRVLVHCPIPGSPLLVPEPGGRLGPSTRPTGLAPDSFTPKPQPSGGELPALTSRGQAGRVHRGSPGERAGRCPGKIRGGQGCVEQHRVRWGPVRAAAHCSPSGFRLPCDFCPDVSCKASEPAEPSPPSAAPAEEGATAHHGSG